MKIRSGFVSNSSSSSFIVAFPKKPASAEDVLQAMFPNNPTGNLQSPWDHVEMDISHTRISEQVFSDLDEAKFKVSKKDLIQEFASRYFVMNKKLYYEDAGEEYYATARELADEYVCVHEEHETERKEFDQFERDMIRHHVGPYVPHAYKNGTNYSAKPNRPYTDEEIKAYDDYEKASDKFRETNAEFIARREKHNYADRNYWRRTGVLARKLGRADLEKFLKDTDGAFIGKFQYADEDGSYFAILEHGGIFSNLKHIQISHH